MKVLGIVGMPGSGKGEFSSVAASMGIPVVVMGDVIRSEVQKAGLPPVDSSMGVVAKQLRHEHGMAAIAKVCIPVIESYQADLVLIDGIRGDAEVSEFAARFPGFTLIAIDSPAESRFGRLQSRARSDDLTDIRDLSARDDRESSFGLRKAMEMATLRISNTGSLDEFRQIVRSTLEQMAGGA
jgi:dephospho-CoA kinase